MYKKDDLRECETLIMGISRKIISRKIKEVIKEKIDSTLEDTHNGFRKARAIQDPIFILKQLNKKKINKSKGIHVYFVYLEKAFDRIQKKKNTRKKNIENEIE